MLGWLKAWAEAISDLRAGRLKADLAQQQARATLLETVVTQMQRNFEDAKAETARVRQQCIEDGDKLQRQIEELKGERRA